MNLKLRIAGFLRTSAPKCAAVFMICAVAELFTGCVIYTHDSSIKSLQPAQAELKDFAGTFKDNAAYFTPPNAIGFEGHETLGGALRGMVYESNVQIEISGTEDIVVKAAHDRFALAPLHYVKGKDFEFTNHCVVFQGKYAFDDNDSPGFGVGKASMTWMLDASRRLVVISGGKGVGFLTVIPVVMCGSTLSIFPRAW